MWSDRRTSRRQELEAALRSLRAEPSSDFVRDVSRRLHAHQAPVRRHWSRLAFAGAMSTLILGVFASLGGFAYTASSATTTYHAVKKIVLKQKVAVTVHKSSASDQYGPTPAPPKSAPRSVTHRANTARTGVAAVSSSGTLPFTGFSLLATVVVSCMLIGLGLVLRRRERNDS